MTDIEGGLITLEYAREGLNIKSSIAAQDADITTYVQAATPVIEGMIGPVLPASKVRSFDGGKTAVVLPDRANAVTSVAEGGSAITDYVFDTDACVIYAGAPAGSRTFLDGVGAVVVSYTVGYADVPLTIQLAARELVRHWWQNGKQANRPAFGEEPEPVNLPLGVPTKRLAELLQPYMDLPGFV